jgi:hypothetical protein
MTLTALHARADSYPPAYFDAIALACIKQSPELFKSRGIELSPGAAQRFCLCNARELQEHVPLADFNGAAQALASVRSGRPLSDGQMRQLAEFQAAGRSAAHSCGCYIQPPKTESYQEFVAPPAACPEK